MISDRCIAFDLALEEVERALDAFELLLQTHARNAILLPDDLSDQDLNVSRWIADGNADERRLAIRAFKVLTYQNPDLDGRFSWDAPGVLEVDLPAVEAALKNVNCKKDLFRHAVNEMSGLFVDEKGNLIDPTRSPRIRWNSHKDLLAGAGNFPKGVYPLVRWHLARSGMANLNLRQTWRHIYVASLQNYAPSTLRFTWLHKRNVKRILALDVKLKLESIEATNPELESVRYEINRLHDKEYLAQVYSPDPQLHVVGCWKHIEIKDRAHWLASLPILVPLVNPDHSLRIKPPLTDRNQRRSRISGRKLEEVPIVPWLNIYRYKENFRILH